MKWKMLLMCLLGGLWWLSSSQSLYAQPAQAASQMDSLERMEERLFEQLRDLKNSSHQLTEDLKTLQQELKISKETSESLSNSLESTLTEFEKCAQSLENTKQKLKEQQSKTRKLTLILAIILISFIGIRVITIVLRVKGFHLPEIVNILL